MDILTLERLFEQLVVVARRLGSIEQQRVVERVSSEAARAETPQALLILLLQHPITQALAVVTLTLHLSLLLR